MKDIFNENVPLKTETPAFAKHVLPAVPLSEVYLEDCVTALKHYATGCTNPNTSTLRDWKKMSLLKLIIKNRSYEFRIIIRKRKKRFKNAK